MGGVPCSLEQLERSTAGMGGYVLAVALFFAYSPAKFMAFSHMAMACHDKVQDECHRCGSPRIAFKTSSGASRRVKNLDLSSNEHLRFLISFSGRTYSFANNFGIYFSTNTTTADELAK